MHFSCSRNVRRLSLPLASTAAVIALTSLTAPAKALSFDWKFSVDSSTSITGGFVNGTISGLLDNTSNQTTGLTLNVTSAPNAPTGGWLNPWYYFSGEGLSVSNGQVTAGYPLFKNSVLDELRLGDAYNYNSELITSNQLIYNVSYYPTIFTPSTSTVPGPLPILGAASALGWSRKVRNRLRSAQRSAV